MRAIGDRHGRIRWLNEPREWIDDGDRVVVHVDEDTDSWPGHTPHFVADSARFSTTVVTGEFTATAEIAGDDHARYDQAG